MKEIRQAAEAAATFKTITSAHREISEVEFIGLRLMEERAFLDSASALGSDALRNIPHGQRAV